MLREIYLKAYRESFESQSKAGRYNPATVVKWEHKGHKRRHVLGVGESDDYSIFVDTTDDTLYVVCTNNRYGYAGIQGYRPDDQEPDEALSVFLQNDYAIAESLGRKGVDLSHRTILNRLISQI